MCICPSSNSCIQIIWICKTFPSIQMFEVVHVFSFLPKILCLRLDTSPNGNVVKTNTFMWKVSAPMNWHFSDENLAPNLWTISTCSLVVPRQPLPRALHFNCIHFHQTLMPLVGLCNFWNVAKTFTVYFS